MKRSKKSRALKRQLDAALSTIRDAERHVSKGGAGGHARDQLAKALRRARKTVRDFKEELGEKDKELGEKDKEIMYLKRREQATRAFNGIHARRGPDPDHRWAVEKRLDYIIGTPKLLKKTTGCTPGQFAEILKDFERDVLARGPLFRGDGQSAGDRGNRCKLYPRHVLLLALCRYYTGLTEDALGTWFGVDQSTVSRYLDLAAHILTDIVVSPKFLTELIKTIGDVDDLKQLIPHLRLLVDGTHIQRERPGDGAQRKAAYSGKKKRFTHNVQVITNCVGLILNLSGAAKGSMHDYALFKKHLAGEGGRWLLELAEWCEAMGEKLKLGSDLGYIGAKKDYPQFEHEQPTKRKSKNSKQYDPKTGGLTKEERERNRAVSKKRIHVERAMWFMKRFRLLRHVYIGTAWGLERDMNVIAGLANMNTLWDHENDEPGPLLAKLLRARRDKVPRADTFT